MKLGAQLGKLNSLPACTSEVAVDSVTGADQVAPPSVEAAPAMV